MTFWGTIYGTCDLWLADDLCERPAATKALGGVLKEVPRVAEGVSGTGVSGVVLSRAGLSWMGVSGACVSGIGVSGWV